MGRAKEKQKKDKGIQTRPMPLGRSCERGMLSSHEQVLSLGGTQVELWSLREPSNRCAEGKAESGPDHPALSSLRYLEMVGAGY